MMAWYLVCASPLYTPVLDYEDPDDSYLIEILIIEVLSLGDTFDMIVCMVVPSWFWGRLVNSLAPGRFDVFNILNERDIGITD